MCRPMRKRIWRSASASVITCAAATAPPAVGNAKKKASPWVSTSTPFSAAHASRTTPRCSARASAYPSAPSSCRSLVEPSTSVKRKVTVPLGRSSRTRRDHPPEDGESPAPHSTPRESVGRRGPLAGGRDLPRAHARARGIGRCEVPPPPRTSSSGWGLVAGTVPPPTPSIANSGAEAATGAA